MGKIYLNQTSLKIRLTTSVDITDARSLKIKYKKPSSQNGELDATEEDATTGVIYYEIKEGSTFFNEVGNWVFWAHVTFSDGRFAAGEPAIIRVYNEGD